MKKTIQHRRMPIESTWMTPNLVYHLNFDGMTNYGNNLLLGPAAEIKHPDSHKKGYLNHLAPITHSIPDHAKPVPIKEYLKYFKHLIQDTYSSPSDMNPAMVNTKALDPELAEIVC